MLVRRAVGPDEHGESAKQTWLSRLSTALWSSQARESAIGASTLSASRKPESEEQFPNSVLQVHMLQDESKQADDRVVLAGSSALNLSMSSHRQGITLVETLVAIAIAAVLITLSLSAIQQARQAARDMQDANNLRQIGLALEMTTPEGGYFPNHHLKVRSSSGLSYVNSPYMKILPHLEGGNEVNASVADNWYSAAPNISITSPQVLRSPNSKSDSPYRSDYVLIVGDEAPALPAGFPGDWVDLNKVIRGEQWFGKSTGVMPVDERLHALVAPDPYPRVKQASITDGKSHTVTAMVGWSGGIPDGQGGPNTQYVDAHWNNPITAVGTLAPGYFTAKLAQETPREALGKVKPGPTLFADGHVQRIGPNVDSAVLRALATRNKGEPTPDF